MTTRKKAITDPQLGAIDCGTPSETEVPAVSCDAIQERITSVDSRKTNQMPIESEKHRRAELRKAKRFVLVSSAKVRWLGADGSLQEAICTVCNISTCGVFVESDASLPTNTNVELEISPVGLRPDWFNPELNFEGKIVRTEVTSSRRGFAVAGFLSLVSHARRVC